MSNQRLSENELINLLENLPSLDLLRMKINAFKEADKSTYSLKEIHTAFFEAVGIVPNAYNTIPPDTVNVLKLYRVRSEKSIDFEKESIDMIRTFSYPPSIICATNGRANIKYKSVFYGADNKETAIAEAGLVSGDIGYLGIWQINSLRNSSFSAFLPSSIPLTNPLYRKGQEIHDQIVHHARRFTQNKVLEVEEIYKFIKDIFVTEKTPYSITSWFANDLLYDSNVVDFIIYPSRATFNQSCNFAFHPNYVDQFFILDKVFKIRIKEISEEGVEYSILEVGEIAKSRIQWRQVMKGDIEKYLPEAIMLPIKNGV